MLNAVSAVSLLPQLTQYERQQPTWLASMAEGQFPGMFSKYASCRMQNNKLNKHI